MSKLTNAQMAPLVALIALDAIEFMHEAEFVEVSEAWPGAHFLGAVHNARRIRKYPDREDETQLPSLNDPQLWLLASIEAGEPVDQPDWMDDKQHELLVGLLEGGAESVIDELCQVRLPTWDD